MGNHKLVLRRGVVCDKCNNYFAREVERLFLEAPLIRHIRQEQGLLGKKGRPLRARVELSTGGEADFRTYAAGMSVARFERGADLLRCLGDKQPMLLGEHAVPPTMTQTSRLLAKIAIGYAATVFDQLPGGIESLVTDVLLDPLRGHARRGHPRSWPVSVRRLYHPDAQWLENGESVQRVWEDSLPGRGRATALRAGMARLGVRDHVGPP